MSSSSTPAVSTTPASIRSKKLVCPKVWKRPHSTIYGKNVEFGSSLYSDKLGEINGRKFNSELPWTMRNSGSSSGSSITASGSSSQGYLSNILVAPSRRSQLLLSDAGSMSSYVDLLESTNPNRTSKRYNGGDYGEGGRRFGADKQQQQQRKRIDFYDQYMDFSREIDHLHSTSLLMNEPLLTRKVFDHSMAFDYDLGLFVPNYSTAATSSGSFSSCRGLLLSPTSLCREDETPHRHHCHHDNNSLEINDQLCSYVPLPTMTQQTQLLPKHKCQLTSSPYGQSNDGRKLSLSAINPQSYRPSLPNKTSTTRASDGEEFEFHDRSSPFYTDRWAGKTIRHFDSDLYSNANLFKSMIL